MAALNVSADLVTACTIDNGGVPLELFFKPIVAKDAYMLGKGELNLAKLTSTKKNIFSKQSKMLAGEDVKLAEDEIVAIERYVAANLTESAFEAKEELVCYIFMDKLVDERGAQIDNATTKEDVAALPPSVRTAVYYAFADVVTKAQAAVKKK